MSHATLTVRITNARLARHDGNVDDTLEDMLAPYSENVDDASPYAKFNEHETEYLAKYETESSTRVRCPDGTTVWPHDERFRVSGFGFGFRTHRVPEGQGYEEIEVSHKTAYPTFEKFMKEYAGYNSRDKRAGRYGSWRNPNAKWDWYSIGGRWLGFFPVKPGVVKTLGRSGAFDNKPDEESDVTRAGDIDFDRVATIERERFSEFKSGYRALLAGKTWSAFEGPRDQLLRCGIMRVEHDAAVTIAEHEVQIGKPWGEEHQHIAGTDRAGWRDIARVLTDAELERYRVICNPLRTFAALDDTGWNEPGEMGWWGFTSDTPDTYLAYAESFMAKVIEPARAANDTLVLVDYHI